MESLKTDCHVYACVIILYPRSLLQSLSKTNVCAFWFIDHQVMSTGSITKGFFLCRTCFPTKCPTAIYFYVIFSTHSTAKVESGRSTIHQITVLLFINHLSLTRPESVGIERSWMKRWQKTDSGQSTIHQTTVLLSIEHLSLTCPIRIGIEWSWLKREGKNGKNRIPISMRSTQTHLFRKQNKTKQKNNNPEK